MEATAPTPGINTEDVAAAASAAINKTQGWLDSLKLKVEHVCENVKDSLFTDNFNSNVRPRIDTIMRLLIPTLCGLIASPGLFVLSALTGFVATCFADETTKKIVQKLKDTWNLSGMSEAPYQMAKIPLYALLPTLTSVYFGLEVGHLGKVALEGKKDPVSAPTH